MSDAFLDDMQVTVQQSYSNHLPSSTINGYTEKTKCPTGDWGHFI